MPPTSSRLKALAAATILLVSAGAGVATFSDDAPSDDRPSVTASDGGDAGEPASGSASSSPARSASVSSALSPADFEGQVLERAQGSYESAPETGTLDLRIDWGPVRVIGWDKAGYEVLALQENASDGAAAHDFETTVDLQDDSSDEAIDVTMKVDRDGTYGAGVQTDVASTEDPHRDRAIVAFVPAGTAFEAVNACSGEEHAFEQAWEDTWGSVPWPWDDDRDVEADKCLGESQGGVGIHADLRRPDNGTEWSYEKTFDFETGAANVQAETLAVSASHDDLAMAGLEAGTLEVVVGHGDVAARDVAADNATYLAGHGDVVLPGASGADLTAFTDHGDVAVDLAPEDDGALSLGTNHGEVEAYVTPASQGIGYNAVTATDHGDLTVDLANASVDRQDRDENASWQDPGYWTGIFQDEGYEKKATATTPNWEDASVQTTVEAFTDHGDVTVAEADEPVDLSLDDEEEEDGER